MADIFVSYARADQEIVGRIVALLEAQGWSVWWDTRIVGGERWDSLIEREIAAARCVVVVWTPQSIHTERVREEADHGHDRGILVPILIGLDKPPFGFRRIQPRNLSAGDGVARTVAAREFVIDVRQKLESGACPSSQHPDLGSARTRQSVLGSETDADRTPGSTQTLTDELAILLSESMRASGEFENCRREPGKGRFRWFKDIDIAPEMVVVPAGEFMMGSNERESERPTHKVTIKEPFAVGRFAVTFAEWDAAGLPYKPSDEGWGRSSRPVINVSWEDAQAYVAWISSKTGKTYRLLSEAEREYVARAGTATAFWSGETISTSEANYNGRSRDGVGEFRHCTVPVNHFHPNPWGLYQVHGNVWEWCEDTWHEDYKDAPRDGSVWTGGDASLRVLRGGSWNAVPDLLRSTVRNWDRVDTRDYSVGFRVARTL